MHGVTAYVNKMVKQNSSFLTCFFLNADLSHGLTFYLAPHLSMDIQVLKIQLTCITFFQS